MTAADSEKVAPGPMVSTPDPVEKLHSSVLR